LLVSVGKTPDEWGEVPYSARRFMEHAHYERLRKRGERAEEARRKADSV